MARGPHCTALQVPEGPLEWPTEENISEAPTRAGRKNQFQDDQGQLQSFPPPPRREKQQCRVERREEGMGGGGTQSGGLLLFSAVLNTHTHTQRTQTYTPTALLAILFSLP